MTAGRPSGPTSELDEGLEGRESVQALENPDALEDPEAPDDLEDPELLGHLEESERPGTLAFLEELVDGGDPDAVPDPEELEDRHGWRPTLTVLGIVVVALALLAGWLL